MILNNSFDIDRAIENLSSVLAVGYFYKFPFKEIEQRIIKSKYFQTFEESNPNLYVENNFDDVLDEIYSDADLTPIRNISFVELDWASEVYVTILKTRKINFEAMFLYLPISKMLQMFKVFHEMDITKSLEEFDNLVKENSIISLRMKELKYTNNRLSILIGVSPSSLNAYRNKVRDISKLDLEHSLLLARYLKIRPDTLLY